MFPFGARPRPTLVSCFPEPRREQSPPKNECTAPLKFLISASPRFDSNPLPRSPPCEPTALAAGDFLLLGGAVGSVCAFSETRTGGGRGQAGVYKTSVVLWMMFFQRLNPKASLKDAVLCL
jgi:hypothetical protein